jgi:arabinose-5-phosphate isomerase
MTGNGSSNLAKEADIHIDVSVEQEACPLNLAPTSSTTAALVMGDALAIALLESRGFTEDDFAKSHPGGTLGRRLLLHIGDIMHADSAIPRVNQDASLRDGLMEMTDKGLGMTVVVDENSRVIGIYTDGDLRRTLDQGLDVHSCGIAEVMTSPCQVAQPEMLAAEALQIMQEKKINAIPIVDKDRCLIGAINMHDLLRAGVV